MPELPEVESVVKDLSPHIVGLSIQKIAIDPSYSRVVTGISPASLNTKTKGLSVTNCFRRGKYIVLELNHRKVITIHLRMSGQILRRPPTDSELKHIRATFTFSNGYSFCFKDVRKFGRIQLLESIENLNSRLGVEPLSPEFKPSYLQQLLGAKQRMLKPLLLDQSCIAGLGNIYVDEALWQARLHPQTLSNQVNPSSLKELHKAVVSVLRKSIKQNGTTFKTFAFGDNKSGDFVSSLKVFGRENQPCERCKTSILKIRVAQRGTHFCPKCQGNSAQAIRGTGNP